MSGSRVCRTGRDGGRVGFTLIELLIVAAILVILLSIILATVKEAPELARRVSCRANLKQMIEGCHMWAKDHQDRFPAGQPATLSKLAQAWGAWGIYAIGRYPPGGSPNVIDTPMGVQANQDGCDRDQKQGAWLGHGALAAAKLCDGGLFYCPSWRDEYSQYGKFVSPSGGNYGGPIWPTWDDPQCYPPQQSYVWTSYHMRSTFPSATAEGGYRAANKRVDKPYEAIFADAFADPQGGWAVDAGHVKGVNAARIAGNVTWFENTADSSGNDRLRQNIGGMNTDWTMTELVFRTLSMD